MKQKLLSLVLAITMLSTSVDMTAFARQTEDVDSVEIMEEDAEETTEMEEELLLDSEEESQVILEEVEEGQTETSLTTDFEVVATEENEPVSEAEEIMEEDTPEEIEEIEALSAILEEEPEVVEEAETLSDEDVTASGTCGENLTWTLENGVLTISGTGEMKDYGWWINVPWYEYRENMKQLVIEDGVKSISDFAFADCSGFSGNLIIPSSVTSIGNGAFADCRGFSGDLILPNSVTSIGDVAFSGCSGFNGNLTIPNSVTSIGNSAFEDCSGFSGDLIISSGVTSIGHSAFEGCSGFSGDLTIPSSVTSIGNSAFEDCSGFSGDLIIPSGVMSIESEAFYNCSGFSGDLIIPSSVTNIGDSAFEDCSGFSGDLIISSGITSIESESFRDCSGFSGDLIIPSSVTNIGDRAFSGCSGFSSGLVIPSSVTNIGYEAFSGCSGFGGDLIIPSGVTSIESAAFSGCSGFSGDLTIPNSVTSIGDYAFSGCSGFSGDLTIPSSVTSIGNSAFEDCSGFTGNLQVSGNIGFEAFYGCSGFSENLMILDTVTSIGDYAFSGCSGFSGDLKIPSSVTSIGNSAFEDCSGFTGNLQVSGNIGFEAFYGCSGFSENLMILDTVTSIGNSAFEGCSGFSGDLKIPSSVTSIGFRAFYGCRGFNKNLAISEGVTNIGYSAFGDCSGFSGNLTIPSSMTSIESAVFSGCSGFSGDLMIPSSVTSIGNGAFEGCSGFSENLMILDTVTSIGNSAFEGCSGFSGDLKIPSSVTSIGFRAFYGCRGFNKNLTISEGVTNIGYSAFGDCSGFSGNLTIPSSVMSIGDYAFSGCSGFNGDLTIPSSVTSIGNGAFEGCSGFSGDLTIPSSVESIGYSAFENCSGFSGNLTIPSSVTSIGYSAFEDCSGFSGDLKIPNSVTSIESAAFSGCSGFSGDLTIPSSVTSIGYSAFEDCSGFSGDLTIPSSVTSIGNGAFEGCSGFSGDLTIPSSVESIGFRAFEDCSGFSGDLKILSSVTSIGDYAFSGCSGFNGDLKIPNSVTSIGDYAFSGCSGFNGDLKIPSSVTSIGYSAFNGCNGFDSVIFLSDVPNIKFWAFSEVTANVYYPSSGTGWDDIANNNYGGTLTWIPYQEGSELWYMDTSETAPQLWFTVTTDISDLSYSSDVGYSAKKFGLNISTYCVGTDRSDSYENVEVTVELLEGLSFSEDSREMDKTETLGTIDVENESAISSSIFIIDKIDRSTFYIKIKATADGYDTPQIYTYKIPVLEWKASVDDYVVGTLEKIDEFEFNVTIDNQVYEVTDDFDMHIPIEILLEKDDKRVVCTMFQNKILKMELAADIIEPRICLFGGKGDIVYQNGEYVQSSKNLQVGLSCGVKKGYKKLNLNLMKEFSLNVENVKLVLPDEGLNFGKKGLINPTSVMKKEETLDKEIIVGETYIYECEVNVEDDFTLPICAKPEFGLNITAAFDGEEVFCKEKIYISNLDYQRQKAEAQKAAREEKNNISKAKSELEKLCNGNYLALGAALSYYCTSTQIDQIEAFLYCWIAQVNNSQTFTANKKINKKIMEKLGINPNVGFFWSQTEATTKINVNTAYGEKEIEFTLNCGSLSSNGTTYGSFGDIKYEVLKTDGIPQSVPTEGLLGITTYVSMKNFINCMQEVAESSIKDVYSKVWGDDANIVASMIVDETMLKILDKTCGSFSDGIYTLFSKPSTSFIKKMRVDCPVDVYVYDLDGNLCGSIVNNVVDSSYEDIVMYVEEDSKIFYLTGDDYQIKLIGNDIGTMDYSIEELDENMKNLRTIKFKDLPLTDEKTYEGTICEAVYVDHSLYALATENSMVYSDEDTYQNTSSSRIYVEAIILDVIEKELKSRENFQLQATISPSDATNQNMIWKSSDETIATVTENGLVTAVKEGKVKISAIADDGKFEAICNINVAGKVEEDDTEDNPTGGGTTDDKDDKPTGGGTTDDKDDKPTGGGTTDDKDDKPTGDGTTDDKDDKPTGGGTTDDKDDKPSDGNTPSDDDSTKDNGDVLPDDIPSGGIPKGIWLPSIDVTYTGSSIKPDVRIYDNKTLLKEKVDYTISYKNNKNAYVYSDSDYRDFEEKLQSTGKKVKTGSFDPAKSPQMILKMKGNYSGTKTVYFKIQTVDISESEVEDLYATYTGKSQKPKPTLIWNDKKLTYGKGKDFYVSEYEDGGHEFIEAKDGVYTLTIVGNNNFTGERKISLTISDNEKQIAMNDVTIKGIKNQKWTGEQLQPSAAKVSYKKDVLAEGTHYTVEYGKNTDIGIGTVTFTATGEETKNSYSYIGSKTVYFQITGTKKTATKNIKDAEVSLKDTKVYYRKGGATPEVEVKDGNTILELGKDYTVKYSNNKKVASSSDKKIPCVTIKGKGNYSGNRKLEFEIVKKPLSSENGVTLVVNDKVASKKKNGYKQSFKIYDADGKVLNSKDYDGKNVIYTLIRDENGVEKNEELDKTSIVSANCEIQLTVKGKGNYEGGELRGTYRIIEKNQNISKATIKIKNQEYTGSPIEITKQEQFEKVFIKVNGTQKELNLGTDIEIVGYTKNVNKGTAKVTLRGIGAFGGTKTVSFKIESRLIDNFWKGIFEKVKSLN